MTQQQRALTMAAAGTLSTLVAFTSPLATLNPISSTLGADAAGRTWILSSMSIGLGAALLSTGTIADDYGRRRTFVIGAIVMAVGSIGCAVSPNVLIFVLARVVQGLGGAAVIASSLGIISNAFPPGPVRAKASGVWGASVGAGIAIGPLLSASFDRLATWRDAYWLLGAATLILALLTHRQVDESRSDFPRGLDLPGAVLLAAGMSLLLAALVEGRQGWTRPSVIILGVTALSASAMFLFVESHTDSAMLDLGLFKHTPFVAVNVAGLATGAGIIALMSYMSGFVGSAMGIDSMGAALLLFTWSASSVVTALLARRIPANISGRIQLTVGLLGVAVGQFLLFGVHETSTWIRFFPGLLIAGIASGVLNAALGREAVASVPAGRGGMGSGANNTARYVGSALGVTVVAVVAAGSGGGTTAALVQGWDHAALVTAAVSVVGAVAVFASRSRHLGPR